MIKTIIIYGIGERIIFPFKYDLYNLSKYKTIDIQAIDKESNSIQLLGSVDLHPACDLGVASTVSNINPHKNDFISVSISVTSYGGDVNGSANITIKFLIPQGLRYINSTPEIGTYDNKTCLWYIPRLIGNKPITLQVRMQVISEGFREFTQFAMIMDGSGSIVASDWQLMRKGFSQAVINDSIFPHDKSVELTVIQFGGSSPPHAQVEIPPTIVNNQLVHLAIIKLFRRKLLILLNYKVIHQWDVESDLQQINYIIKVTLVKTQGKCVLWSRTD